MRTAYYWHALVMMMDDLIMLRIVSSPIDVEIVTQRLEIVILRVRYNTYIGIASDSLRSRKGVQGEADLQDSMLV